MVDRQVEHEVSISKYARYADRSFHFQPMNEDLIFTRRPKPLKDNHPYNPFTDSGSRFSRVYFPREDYIHQHPVHGMLPVRGIQPRLQRFPDYNDISTKM